MATLDELLAEDSETPRSVEEILSEPAATMPMSVIGAKPATATSEDGLPWYEKAARGVMDPLIGAGQLIQRGVGETAANFLRAPANLPVTAGVVPQLAGAVLPLVAASAQPTTTAQLDKKIAAEEAAYQEKRGDEGLDWWRIGGAMANPMSWMGPTGSVSGIFSGLRAGAQAGSLQALMQPVTTEGSFLWDKGAQALTGGLMGGAFGGTLGGAFQVLRPALSVATRAARSALGLTDDATVAGAQAGEILDDTLTRAGINPAQVDRNVYSVMQREVAAARQAGIDPDPKVMERMADAAALNPPVFLTRAEALRNPMMYAREHRLRGLEGVGEPLTTQRSANNRALIENLNNAGARNALQPFDASQRIIQHIEGVDTQLRANIKQAYDAVKNTGGQPARVSNADFVNAARNALTDGRPELARYVNRGDFLPEKIREVYNDISTGALPLTVDTIQFLDRHWGEIQRGAKSDEALAIGTLRRALFDTPIQDALGQESMAAYTAAKALAKQRFGLIDSNPAYKAIVEETARSEPDRFFQNFVVNADVSALRSLKQLIGGENTQVLQNTMLANLKRIALSGASDENGVFSQAAFNKTLGDFTQGPRIRELFADNPQTLDRLYRLGRVSESMIKVPDQAIPNVSGTAIQATNIVRDVMKSEAGQAAAVMIPNTLQGLSKLGGGIREKMGQRREVQEALTPAVTSTQIPRRLPAPPTVSRLSDLVSRAGGAAAASEATNRRQEDREY